MAKKLNTFVHVFEKDSDGNPTGRAGTFGPDDKLESWAEKAITNPDVWADGQDDGGVSADGAANTDSGTADLAEAAAEGGEQGAEQRPAKSTRRSSGR